MGVSNCQECGYMDCRCDPPDCPSIAAFDVWFAEWEVGQQVTYPYFSKEAFIAGWNAALEATK